MIRNVKKREKTGETYVHESLAAEKQQTTEAKNESNTFVENIFFSPHSLLFFLFSFIHISLGDTKKMVITLNVYFCLLYCAERKIQFRIITDDDKKKKMKMKTKIIEQNNEN